MNQRVSVLAASSPAALALMPSLAPPARQHQPRVPTASDLSRLAAAAARQPRGTPGWFAAAAVAGVVLAVALCVAVVAAVFWFMYAARVLGLR